MLSFPILWYCKFQGSIKIKYMFSFASLELIFGGFSVSLTASEAAFLRDREGNFDFMEQHHFELHS